MDLQAEADRLRLDVLAVALCAALGSAGVPHALIKGPSTATWLYDPPRSYCDVVLLVPLTQASRAAAVLDRAGLAQSRSGRPGEEAPHSLLLHSSEGFEIDLHISLPTVPPDGDRIWEALAPHLTELQLDVGVVPTLDEVGRCLVLALHALNSTSTQSAEDLTRARAVCGSEVWAGVSLLGSALGIDDLVEAGIAFVEGGEVLLSHRARLYVIGAPEAAFGLQRLADARRRDLPRLIWQEVLPSRGFMTHSEGVAELRGPRLAAAHLSRWRRLARQLPAALRARRNPK